MNIVDWNPYAVTASSIDNDSSAHHNAFPFLPMASLMIRKVPKVSTSMVGVDVCVQVL